MRRQCRLAAATIVALFCAALVPRSAGAQSAGPTLGMRGVGAVTIFGGYAAVEQGFSGAEVGLNVDLGHFGPRRIRLAAEGSFLRTFKNNVTVVLEDSTYRDVFYDLSGHVDLVFYARDPESRVAPFANTGIGVHVLTSSFGSPVIDRKFNTNNFGLRMGAGSRFRIGSSAAVTVDFQVILSREVSRGVSRLGLARMF